MPLSPTLVLRRSPSVMSASIGDEAVLFDSETGVYYSLNPVAARVWELAEQSLRLDQIQAALIDQFAVTSEDLEADLVELVSQMVCFGLWASGVDRAR